MLHEKQKCVCKIFFFLNEPLKTQAQNLEQQVRLTKFDN